MGQANKRGPREERIRNAAKRKHDRRQHEEEKERAWRAEVEMFRLKNGLDVGLISGCHQRIVAVRLDDLNQALERARAAGPEVPRQVEPDPTCSVASPLGVVEPAEEIVPGEALVGRLGHFPMGGGFLVDEYRSDNTQEDGK